MKNIITKTIKLHKLFGLTISTREAARLVLEKINELNKKDRGKSVSISFANVEFVSRSFADELCKIKEKIEKQKKCSIRFIYVNKIIQNILKKVSKTQNKKMKKSLKIPSFTVNTDRRFEEIFQKI